MHLVGTDIIVEFGPKEHEENGVGIVDDCMMDITTIFTLGIYSLNFPLPGKCVSNNRRCTASCTNRDLWTGGGRRKLNVHLKGRKVSLCHRVHGVL